MPSRSSWAPSPESRTPSPRSTGRSPPLRCGSGSAGARRPDPVVVVHRVETRRAGRLSPDPGRGRRAGRGVRARGGRRSRRRPRGAGDRAGCGGRRPICRYLQVQLLGPDAWQIGLQASRVARDASLTSAAVALGGEYARVRTDSALDRSGRRGPAAGPVLRRRTTRCTTSAPCSTTRRPKTRSDLLYKGAVANSARSVYSGLIRVEKGAAGHQRHADQPQPRAARGRARRLGPEPRDRGQRRALQPRLRRRARSRRTSASTWRAGACRPTSPTGSSPSGFWTRCSSSCRCRQLGGTVRRLLAGKLDGPIAERAGHAPAGSR